jgi:hypothetical protein
VEHHMDTRPTDPDSAHGAESSTMIGGSRLSRAEQRVPAPH